MSSARLTQPYTPNPLLKALYKQFDKIAVDQAWVDAVRSHATRGTVVYILRNLNLIDFLALDHLTKRLGLPQVRFANDLGLGVFNPLGKSWLSTFLPADPSAPAEQLKQALGVPGGSAVLFLKRPPTVLDVVSGASGGRGLREGDALMGALIQVQRESERPILLVPQVFVWTKRPDTRGTRPLDRLFGPREWPSAARVIGQFLSNPSGVALRAGEPVDLQEFLREAGTSSDGAVLNKVTYTMLRRLERERRSITGPAAKAPDRIRQEILRSRRFQSAVSKLTSTSEDREKLLKSADSMLREMQALPSGAATSFMDVALEKIFSRIYHGIEIDEEGLGRVREAAKEGTLILLPSHKSHIDYLVVSYMFYQASLPLPYIVAGDNLAFFPMGLIFRRAGAFFIRRSFRGDRLYPVVVDAYVRRLIKDGHNLEVFLEGMRSRSGKLLNPKFGLLNMIITSALSQDTRPVHFVPISIGYERIIETESFHHELSGGDKIQEDAAGLLGAADVLRNRYGRINLQFGQVLTLEQVAKDVGAPSLSQLTPRQSRAIVTRLGNQAMDEINRVTAVTPGAITALAVLSHHRRGIEHDKLVRHCERLLQTLRSLGARWTPSLATESCILKREAIRESLQMFADADMVEIHSTSELSRLRDRGKKAKRAGPGAVYTVVEAKRIEFDTSKNIIVHFFVERALLATAMIPATDGQMTKTLLLERLEFLAKLFKFEFRLRGGVPVEQIFESVLAEMIASQDLVTTPEGEVRPGPGRDGWTGHKWLLAYAALIRNFFESYRIFARSLAALLQGDLAEKELIKRALNTGNSMYLAGEIERREAISKPVMQNALAAFQEMGVVRSKAGLLTLDSGYQNEERLSQLERPIAGYLDREGRL
ncbi:MAG: hypothetical protein RJA70_3456 [Pseudomonadota bacterium]|jgi:glycerol-3-phosphate O-acyltransferase